MRRIIDSKAIFAQLADTPGSLGVQTVIENHDAWLQNGAVELQVTAALKAKLAGMPRSETTAAKIERQKKALESLVVRLPMRLSSAG